MEVDEDIIVSVFYFSPTLGRNVLPNNASESLKSFRRLARWSCSDEISQLLARAPERNLPDAIGVGYHHGSHSAG